MTTEPETTLEPDNDDEGGDTVDPVEHEAVLAELGISDETIDATPEEVVALVARLAAQANTAEEGRMRALADFRNFQRRSIENEGRARKEGLSGVVRSLLPALDHFDLALQSVGDFTEARKRATERAFDMLDVLDELKLALLEGGLPRAKLEALMKLLQTRRDDTNDEQLEAALNEVETRAAVELAKFS